MDDQLQRAWILWQFVELPAGDFLWECAHVKALSAGKNAESGFQSARDC